MKSTTRVDGSAAWRFKKAASPSPPSEGSARPDIISTSIASSRLFAASGAPSAPSTHFAPSAPDSTAARATPAAASSP